MVRPKNKENKNWFKEELKRVDKRCPVVDVKWAVQEVAPSYNTGGYYSEYVPEAARTVSPKFDTREEAEAWMNDHEADKGKYLAVAKFIAREHKHINWTIVRMR